MKLIDLLFGKAAADPLDRMEGRPLQARIPSQRRPDCEDHGYEPGVTDDYLRGVFNMKGVER